jgi:hypothetical protein
MEERIARLEGAFGQWKELAGGIDRRLDRIEQTIETRFSSVELRFGQIDQSFAQIEACFSQMDQKFVWLTGVVVGTWITTMLTVLFHH